MTFVKIFAFTAMVSSVLLACSDTGTNNERDNSISSSSSVQTKIPVMDSRVLSYKKFAPFMVTDGSDIGFITDKDILTLAYPHIFENEQPECKYFALYFPTSSISYDYVILSQDMILYEILPDIGDGYFNSCGATGDYLLSAMLICDDTVEGNLKDKIELHIYHLYNPDWNSCDETEYDRGVFF